MPGGSNHNNDRRETVNPNRGFSPNKPRHYGSTKELVARAIHACGGVEEAMLVLDRSRSTVYEYTEETKPLSHLSYDGARRLTRLAGVTVFAEDMAALAGGIVGGGGGGGVGVGVGGGGGGGGVGGGGGGASNFARAKPECAPDFAIRLAFQIQTGDISHDIALLIGLSEPDDTMRFAPIAREDGASRTWSDLGGIATAEFAQFIQVLLRSLTDSKIDARERARLKREVDDVIRIMAEARAKLESGES